MATDTGLVVIQESDPARALEVAFAGGPDACVAGSIFLVGAMLSLLRPRGR